MIRIAHVSDLHFGAIAEGTPDALLESIAAMEPTLVVVSGDLTLAGRKREFREAAAFLRRIGRPTLVVPGNHDVPAYALHRRFTTPTSRFQEFITPDLRPTFHASGLFALGLNTARPWDLSWNWSHGRFSNEQVRHADGVFGAQAAVRAADASPGADRLAILVAHHPLIVPEEIPGFRVAGRAASMLGVLARRRVDLVLSGHLHHGYWRRHEIEVEAVGRSVLMIQASTATSTRRREHANAFNVLDVEGDSMTLAVWEWDGRRFGEAERTGFSRDAHGWNPLGPASDPAAAASSVVAS
ncbi:MAG: metallophosphoesterase [Phycisphaerales bacterium]